MPVISRFYGILVVMYFNDHRPPHVHAKYAGFEASFMREWLDKHSAELQSHWHNARAGQPLDYIAPLE
jgi:hypothetical protein